MLAGAAAFGAIAAQLSKTGASFETLLADPALERLRRALLDPRASSLDLAVLIRQGLVYEAGRSGSAIEDSRLPRPTTVAAEDLEHAGLALDLQDRLSARTWRPDWLVAQPDGDTVEGFATRAVRLRFDPNNRGTDGDPFLERLDRQTYRSVGQRAAVRSALLTPAGQAIAIDLPTGEGKSLVFQAINTAGFASDPDADASGLTVVVVPTVGLAYDHERQCRKTPEEMLAYVGSGGEARRQAILQRLNGTGEGLLFAAPEAVCKSLRGPLVRLAQAGRLKALIIDEAHLVDAWGTGFRTEFQTLAGLRDELVKASPPTRQPRTILLSATLTPETLDTLRTLFGVDGDLPLVSAAQVRPEADYWVAHASPTAERAARILEALAHVPRPAILYVTEVSHAIAWHETLGKLGYSRLATFHGRTSDSERVAILKSWSEGDLDLVVATSAFGLGIDYPHVRTVIHACVPETFDRFYQEVGRGGRDGCTAMSLVIPAHGDFRVAAVLNRERVISAKRGLERWSAMFSHAETRHLGEMRFRVPLDVAPGSGSEDIDLVGERSTQWNARVLTLMARAGVLRLSGSEFDADAQREDGVYETVDLLTDRHLEAAFWQTEVEPARHAVAEARRRNLSLMVSRLREQPCPGDQVRALYSASRVDLACPRCAVCREDPLRRHPTAARTEPGSPWAAGDLRADLLTLLDDKNRLALFYDPDVNSRSDQRRISAAFDALFGAGVRCIAQIGDLPVGFDRALRELSDRCVFLDRVQHAGVSRLPTGPRLVLHGPGRPLKIQSARFSAPRIYVLPYGVTDMDRPGDSVIERWGGSAMPILSLVERIGL